MRKKIEHLLEYRENGEDKSVIIEIDFASNRIIKDFSDLMILGSKAEKAHIRMSDIYTIIAGENLTSEQKENFEIELKKCELQILEFNGNNYFDKRFNLLKKLLIDNGHKENKMLMSIDFWEENVDPLDLINFLYSAIYKDVNKKKVYIR